MVESSTDVRLNAIRSVLQPANDPAVLGLFLHYQVRRVLGVGASSIVLEAFDAKLQRLVAIKVLAAHRADQPDARRRFVREARAAAAILHENVVSVYAVDELPLPHIVMEHVRGQSLQQLLDQVGRLLPDDVVHLGQQVASGLVAAHLQGVIHRDIKPANILLVESDARRGAAGSEPQPPFVIKVADFGVARALDDDHLTHEDAIIGTPLYMAPEQAQNNEIDDRADLFSLGCVLYAACTGQSPFAAPTALAVLRKVCEQTPVSIRSVNPEVPVWLEDVIFQLLEKSPERRPAKAADVLGLLDQRRGTLPPVSRISPARSPGNRWLLVPAACLVLGCLAVLLVFWRGHQSDSRTGISSTTGISTTTVSTTEVPKTIVPQLAVDPDDPPSPADFLQASAIPRERLMDIGKGDAQKAPPELVAVLAGEGPFRHMQDVVCLRYSPDGRLVATCTENSSTVEIWDAITGEYMFWLKGHTGNVRKLAFSRDSRFLATASQDSTAKIWNIQARRPIQTLAGQHEGVVSAVGFNPQGDRIVTAGHDRTARIWSAADGEVMQVLRGHTDSIEDVEFSRDGTRIVTAAHDGTARVWNAITGQELVVFKQHNPAPGRRLVCSARFSPDGRQVVSCADQDPLPLVWSSTTGAIDLKLEAHQENLFNVCWSEDGTRIAGAGGEGILQECSVLVWDAHSGNQIVKLKGHTEHILTVALSPDGQRLISAGRGRQLRVWDLTDAKEIPFPSTGHSRQVHGLAWSSDGNWLVSASEDETVILWDVSTGKPIRTMRGHTGNVYGVAFDPTLRMICSGGQDGTLRLWDIESGQQRNLFVHTTERREFVAVAFSPDGKWLLSAAFGDASKLWNLETGQLAHELPRRDGWNASFSPDSTLALVAYEGCGVGLSDVESGKELGILQMTHGSAARGLAIQPQGRLLAVGKHWGDGQIHLWDLPARREVLTLTGHQDFVLACAWNSNGTILASAGSTENAVRVWDMSEIVIAPQDRSDKPPRCRVVSIPVGGLRTVAISPDGRHVAVGTAIGQICLLRMAKPGAEIWKPER